MKDAARDSKATGGGDNVQQCPHCGDRAVLENYESWTPVGGWKKMQRLNCLNTKPRDPELRCGKVTIIEESEMSQQTQPPAMSTGPAASRSTTRPSRSVSVPAAVATREMVTEVAPRPPVARPSLIPSVRPAPAPVVPTDEVPRGQKYTMEQYSELIALIEGGMTCPAAAAKVGIQKNTAYGIIGQYRRRLRGVERGGRVVQAVAQQAAQEPVRVVRPVEVAPPPSPAPARVAVTAEQVVLAQLAAAGLSGHVRLLVSDDLAAFFRLPREIQEAIRAFFELPVEARRQISGLLPGSSWEAAG